MHDIQRFITGFKSFRDDYFCREDSPFGKLRKRQKPGTMVIACADSRTDPALILQCEPGEVFVVRNIANIVPPYEPDTGYHGVSAAIEYAVKALEVENLIILGHSNCGGIRALMEDSVRESEFVGPWLSVMKDVRQEVLGHWKTTDDKACTACEMAGILQSIENLMSFPFIAERVKACELTIHGWYFDMETGRLMSYVPQTGTFEPLTQGCPGSGGAGDAKAAEDAA